MYESIKFLIVDVDGTLTDTGVYYDEHGNELKRFSTKDGAGFFACEKGGIEIIIITGRECAATTRRIAEFKVKEVYQNIRGKVHFIEKYLEERGIKREEIGYIGDDINDVPSMKLCGFVGCPADSCREVLELADYVSPVRGGYGAMRDVVEHIFRERGQWEDLVKVIYGGI